jgi:tRNA threonylcarbamoyladenosine biosynthesis protein TsaB
MLGLAVDTSGPYLGLLLYDQEKCIRSVQHTTSRDHCASLIPQIQTLLQQCSFTLQDIQQWSVVVGPGSFTGLRVGIMTVKTLAMANPHPIVAVQNFDRLAHTLEASETSNVGLIWPAQKDHVYVCIHSRPDQKPSTPPSFMALNDVPWNQAELWLQPDWMPTVDSQVAKICPVSFAQLCEQAWHASIVQSKQHENHASLQPWYIQPSYAQKPRV